MVELMIPSGALKLSGLKIDLNTTPCTTCPSRYAERTGVREGVQDSAITAVRSQPLSNGSSVNENAQVLSRERLEQET